MKKFWKTVLALALLVSLFFFGFALKNRILTALYGDEFRCLSQVGIDFMTAYDPSDFDLRVLSYSSKTACIYYFSEDGGEKVMLEKKDGHWSYSRNVNTWVSSGGSADDYFIFPYYKVPLF